MGTIAIAGCGVHQPRNLGSLVEVLECAYCWIELEMLGGSALQKTMELQEHYAFEGRG
jgi:hypothetical protein